MARDALSILVVILISIGLGYALAVITLQPDQPLVLQPRPVIAVDTVYKTDTRIRYIHDTVYAEVIDTIYQRDTIRIPLTLYWWLYKDQYVSIKLRTVYLDSFSYKLNFKPIYPKHRMLGLAYDSRSYLWVLFGYKNALLGIGKHADNYNCMLGIRWTF